jgi:hypothetical protein
MGEEEPDEGHIGLRPDPAGGDLGAGGALGAGEAIATCNAVVVGAGLYLLHRLRDVLGLSVGLYESAPGVGGTW